MVPGAFGEFDGVFWSQKLKVHVEHIFSDKNLETHNPIVVDSFNIATDPFAPPFFDFFVGLFFCLNMSEMAFVAICTSFFQTCNSDTREDARTHMTEFLQTLNRHGISLFLSEELSSLLPDSFEDFCPSPSVCFAFEWGEDDRTFRLWPSPLS